jgi:CO/xanthine dehydrogenase FAD-binding subunit
MKAFELIAARDARHAVALLAENGPSARVLAGGTDLVPELQASNRSPAVIIDLSRAMDLQGIDATDQGLRIGALVTHAELGRSRLIREQVPALAEAAQAIGAVQTRNRGTIGGNLASAVPSLDSGPPLIALEALVTLSGLNGVRQISLEEFFLGPRRNALQAGELLVDVVIPAKNLGKPSAFQKFGLRRGQALALVNVAAAFRIDQDANAFVEPRISLGAVAPTVLRARRAESFLEGRDITTRDAMGEAATLAAAEAKPISDFRASAGYRRELISVLVRRALERVHDRALPSEGARP